MFESMHIALPFYSTQRTFQAVGPNFIPRLKEVRIDSWTLLLTAFCSVATAVRCHRVYPWLWRVMNHAWIAAAGIKKKRDQSRPYNGCGKNIYNQCP